jgi:hypothetical protein
VFGNYSRQGEEACERCRVSLIEENVDAWKVYNAVKRQYVIAEMGRVVDLSVPAILAVMGLYKVRNREQVFDDVHWLFHKMQERTKDVWHE